MEYINFIMIKVALSCFWFSFGIYVYTNLFYGYYGVILKYYFNKLSFIDLTIILFTIIYCFSFLFTIGLDYYINYEILNYNYRLSLIGDNGVGNVGELENISSNSEGLNNSVNNTSNSTDDNITNNNTNTSNSNNNNNNDSEKGNNCMNNSICDSLNKKSSNSSNDNILNSGNIDKDLNNNSNSNSNECKEVLNNKVRSVNSNNGSNVADAGIMAASIVAGGKIAQSMPTNAGKLATAALAVGTGIIGIGLKNVTSNITKDIGLNKNNFINLDIESKITEILNLSGNNAVDTLLMIQLFQKIQLLLLILIVYNIIFSYINDNIIIEDNALFKKLPL